MKINIIKFFVIINLWIVFGIIFTTTTFAQSSTTQNVNTTSTSRRTAPIPPASEISKIQSCYQYILSASPEFPSGIQGLSQKIPNGVALWYEWGVNNTTYTNKLEKKKWTYKEIADEQGNILNPPISKEWIINLNPDTVYSYILAFEVPAGGERRQAFTKFSYPKFFKTNNGFTCLGEGEELYFKELDTLTSLAMFNPTKKIVSAYSLKNDPDAVPLSLVPSGTIISKPAGTCTAGMVMSNSGAFVCGSIVSQFNAMVDAAKRDGITLKSGAYSGIRTREMQIDMRKNRACRNDNETMCPGGQIAAVGASNHGNGEAADFACYSNGRLVKPFSESSCYTWLTKNASKFGFYNNLPKDRVHWSRTGK